MRARSFILSALVALVASAPALSCTSSSNGATSADAGADADDDVDATLNDDTGCNPCIEYCACTPGDTFVSPSNCMTYTCVDGVWGKMGCSANQCDGGDEDDGDDEGGDATSSDATSDGPMEGAPDATLGADASPVDGAPEVSLPDGPAVDASGDAPGSAPTDASGQ